LSEKIEDLRIAEMTVAHLKKANEEQENHVESLMKKLQDSQEIEGKMEENYRQELKSQRKVAELYRGKVYNNYSAVSPYIHCFIRFIVIILLW